MVETWVKFCGCTSWHDARQAVDAGADAIGMIFAPSPRRIEREAAVEIARRLPPSTTPVTVFVDPSEADVAAVLELFPRAMVQFSGAETPRFVARYGERAIKAIHVGDAPEPLANRCDAYRQALLLFDSFANGLAGGTGTAFAWERIAGIAASRPVVVAGGLTPANVTACLDRARPYGVDVRTGVETGGRKDGAKMRAFVRAVRQAR